MSIQQAVEAIIRPPRTIYDIKKLPKVLESDDEEDGGGIFIRIPMEIELPRNKLIVRGSIYHSGLMKLSNPGPCVIYMHGNASSQLEGQFLVPNLCPHNVFVVCFDFIGCGCSDGEYVSLGYFERGDTEFIISILRDKYNLGPFILWGRSMGAATALIVKNPSIAGIISDSGFTSIRNMVKAIARQHGVGKVFMKPTLWFLKNKIESLANFDINSVCPLKEVPDNKTPVLFAQATDDKLIPYEHCELLYNAYGGQDKKLIKLTGGHNGRRPLEFIRDGVKFCLEKLGLPTRGLIISPCRNLMKCNFHFESFEQMIGNNGPTFNAASLVKEVTSGGSKVAEKIEKKEEEEDDDYSELSFQIEEEDKKEEDSEKGEEEENVENAEEEEIFEEDVKEENINEEDAKEEEVKEETV